MLRENRSLQSLNIESNFISSTGLMAVLKAVRENGTLTELRVDNQVSIPSPESLHSASTLSLLYEVPLGEDVLSSCLKSLRFVSEGNQVKPLSSPTLEKHAS